MTSQIIVEQREFTVLSVGEQGPPGPQGPAGPADSSLVDYVAGEALGGNRVVRADTNGKAVYASNTVAASQNLLGITTGSASLGATATVQRSGIMAEPSWSWTAGQLIYLGTNGVMTQVYPAGATIVIIVGFALTPTSIHISPREPIFTA